MIIHLHPPKLAGPLFIGAAGQEALDILRQLGQPLVICGIGGQKPGWGVERPSGLFIGAFFDAQGRVDAIELSRPGNSDDVVTYNGLDVFTTPAADLVTWLRLHTTLREQELDDEHRFTAPDLLLTFLRFTTDLPDSDPDGRYFHNVLLALPSYYNQGQQHQA
jgi:hypothetical protein